MIVLVVGYIVLCLDEVGRGEDANIGLGTGLLGLGVLGFPWTQPLLTNHSVSVDSWAYVAPALGGLALNLVLHAFAWWFGGRTRR